MTETEWFACNNPQAMLEFLEGKASDRKLRLFAVACCRRIWHLLPDKHSRNAVKVAERFADGAVSRNALLPAFESVRYSLSLNHPAEAWVKSYAAAAAKATAQESAQKAALQTGYSAYNAAAFTDEGAAEAERVSQVQMLHDITGPLAFRPVYLDPSWLTWNAATGVKLAEAIYEDRAFDRLPILADALEDAACDEADILDHCRQPGPHVRGCWLIDLLTGRE
jgi:hypothetical protein